MKSQFRAVNRFISKIKSTSSIDWISNSGTFQIQDIAIGWFSLPQWAFTYFVTADFAQTGKEEIFRIVNTAWDVLTYDKRISVWGYVKPTHAAGASIRVNDVADILNEMSDNIDNFGDINQIDGTQTVKVWWGVFNNGGTVYNVSSQTLIVTVGQLVDNTTNYIHFDIATRLFIVTASSTLAAAVCMASVVVSGWIIGTITDLRPGFAMTYGEISTKLDKSGGLRDTMITANTTTDWLFIAGKTKVPLVNPNFATGAWTRSSTWWIGDSTYGWYVGGGVGTYSAAYDTGRMKLQTSAVGSYLEVWVSAGYYPIDQYAIPVEPNTAYTVEYDMETLLTSGTSNDGAWIQVCTYDSGWASIVEIPGTKVKTTTGNTHYTINFTTWPVTRYINPQMRIYGHTGTATLQMSAWFDNITVTCASKEVLKPISQSASLTNTDELLIEKQDWTYTKAPYSALKTDIGNTFWSNSVYAAWEAIALNDFVCIERRLDFSIWKSEVASNQGSYAFSKHAELNMWDTVGTSRRSTKLIWNWTSQTTIKVALKKFWTPTDNVVVRIETDDGTWKPSGTLAHANATGNQSWAALSSTITGMAEYNVTFAGAFTLTNLTPYHVVVQRSTAIDASNYYKIGHVITTTVAFNTNVYNGTVWWTPLTTHQMALVFGGEYASVLVRTRATSSIFVWYEWVASASCAQYALCTVNKAKVINTFSWLTKNSVYFLSNTPWAISTTAGTVWAFAGTTDETTTWFTVWEATDYDFVSALNLIFSGWNASFIFRASKRWLYRYDTSWWSSYNYHYYTKNGTAVVIWTPFYMNPGDVFYTTSSYGIPPTVNFYEYINTGRQYWVV